MRRYRNGDAEIRTLERALRADPSDLNAYIRLLREKVRAGILSHDRLVMAARLGHAAAQGAAPEWAGQRKLDWDLLYFRQEAIRALGDRREIALFACDCAERVVGVFEHSRPDDPRPRTAIEAGRVCATDPSIKNKRAAADAANAANAARTNFRDRTGAAEAAVDAARAAAAASINDAVKYAGYAAYAADSTYVRDARASFEAEQLWQRERLAQYLLREI